jgi:Secretion system C-terminal sorting domain
MNQKFSLRRFFIISTRTYGIVFTLFFSCFFNSLYAQNPTLVWAKTYGGSKIDLPNAIAVTKDNKYLVAGWTTSNDLDVGMLRGLSDAWLLKLDENGNILWKKTYGGSDNDGINAISQTLDNGFILVGSTNSSNGDVVENKGGSDCWIIKIDSLGSIQWQKTIGGSKDESLWSVFQTQNGDYIMGGYSTSNDKDFPQNAGLEDMWILKLNNQGTLIWKKRIGGSKYDLLSQITNIDDKTFAIAARTDSQDGDMVGALGDFSVKMDSSGNIVWKKSFGYYNEGSGLKELYGVTTSKNNMVHVGMKIVERGTPPPKLSYSWDFLITKSDTAGNRLWSKHFGGTESERAKSIQALSNGDLLISGSAQSDDLDVTGHNGGIDFWVIRIDSLGNLKNANCYGGSQEDQGYASVLDKQGNLIVVGYSTSSNGTFPQNRGSYDFALIKLKYGLTGTVKTENDVDITVYPNPVEEELRIETPLSILPVFRLYDVAGKLIYQSKISENIKTIDMHNLPQGFYMLTYQLGNKYHTKKIFKL